MVEGDEQAVSPDELRAAVWERVRMARNVKRPHTLELVQMMASEVIELHGDRLFRDDAAVVGGFCRIDGRRAVFVGHQKGAETDENIRRNFGMPHPEGYRKAMRLYQLAERLQLPVVTFVDTPGAFPGTRVGGARRGRGDRALDHDDDPPAHADRDRDHRRGRLRRRAGAGRRRRRAGVRELDLLGHQPGGRGEHPVAQRGVTRSRRPWRCA